jgi:hypothetical protein
VSWLAGRGLRICFLVVPAAATSGKAEAVRRLMARMMLQPQECAVLFDGEKGGRVRVCRAAKTPVPED